MVVFISLAVGLILAGLVMSLLSGYAKFPLLATIVFWIGIVLVVFGVILLISPFLTYLAAQIRAALEV